MNTTAPGVPLGTPIQDGVRWTNFFNGRLLTGDDLSGDQDAGRAARLQLGVAGGAGVAWGLSVRPGPSSSTAQPTLQITAGLAVNSLGKPLALAADVEVSLLAPATPAPSIPPDVGFTTCAPPAPPPTYLTGSGVYVLVIGPAERGEGSATVNGQIQAAPARTVGYYADTVQFRVAAAPIPANDAALADPNKARNRVAYRFLGATDVRRTAFEADPLGGGPAAYGLIDDMIGTSIAITEVPLAAVYWTTADGFQFVDTWAVRRRMARPIAEAPWAPLVEDRAAREGEAMFLQFQAQIARPPASGLGTALSTFDYLPPAGFLPLAATTTSAAPPTPASASGGTSTQPRAADSSAASTGTAGSSPAPPSAGFFDGLTTRGPFFINGARVDELIRESFFFSPIDLNSGELIWVYEIRENQQPGLAPAGAPVAVLFTTGHMRYRGNAQYDLAHFDYSNFALPVD